MASQRLTAEQITAWAESQHVPDISALAATLDVENMTGKMRKILAVMMLPQAIALPTTKKAELAGVTERYWYIVIQKPHFMEQARRIVRQTWGHVIPEMQAKYIELARSGDRQAIERILEQADGLDKQEKGSTGGVTVNVAVVEQKRHENIKTGLERFGYTVSDN